MYIDIPQLGLFATDVVPAIENMTPCQLRESAKNLRKILSMMKKELHRRESEKAARIERDEADKRSIEFRKWRMEVSA